MRTIKFLLLCSCAVLLLTSCPEPDHEAKFQYLNLNVTELTLSHSDTYSLIAEANEGADLSKVTWATTDTMVKVDAYGNLEVTSRVDFESDVTITASVNGEDTESGQMLTASCVVTVINEQKLITFNSIYGPWNQRIPTGVKDSVAVISSDGRQDTLPCELYRGMLVINGGSSGIVKGDVEGYVNWVSVPGDFFTAPEYWYCFLVYDDVNGDGSLDTLSLIPAAGDTMPVVSMDEFDENVVPYAISAGSFDDERALNGILSGEGISGECIIRTWIWRFYDNELHGDPCSFIREGSYFVMGDGDVNEAWALGAYEVYSSPFYTATDDAGEMIITHPIYRLKMENGNYEETVEVTETPASVPAINNAGKVYRLGYSNQELRHRDNLMKTLSYAEKMRLDDVVSAMK